LNDFTGKFDGNRLQECFEPRDLQAYGADLFAKIGQRVVNTARPTRVVRANAFNEKKDDRNAGRIIFS
jgi:hypothetical protein